MKAWLKTWRFGIVETLSYHGTDIVFDGSTMTIHVIAPVLSSPEEETQLDGVLTVQTFTSGDELTIANCDESCQWHASEQPRTWTACVAGATEAHNPQVARSTTLW